MTKPKVWSKKENAKRSRQTAHALKKLHSTDKKDWLTMKTLKNGC